MIGFYVLETCGLIFTYIHFTVGSMKDRCALFAELTSPCVTSGRGGVMLTGHFRLDQNIYLTFNYKNLFITRCEAGCWVLTPTSTFIINTRLMFRVWFTVWSFIPRWLHFTIFLSVSQTCDSEGMEFTLRIPEGFWGRIYTHNHYGR